MLVVILASAELAASTRNPLVIALLVAQLIFYALSGVGYVFARRGLRLKLFYVPFYFTFAQIALGASWFRWARGQRDFSWQPTERLMDAN
jgi:poly-beta-1,6-N-acetyl-D-glucosamine synthase